MPFAHVSKIDEREMKASDEFTMKEQCIRVRMWVLFGLFFMLSNFYRLHLHNGVSIAVANLQLSVNKNRMKRCNLPIFSYGYHKCLFVGSLTQIHIASQLCSLLSVE